MIDTSRIEVGKIYKSYRELCIAMGEDIKSGETKLKHIDKFTNVLLFSKVEKGFYVYHVYDILLNKTIRQKLLEDIKMYLINKYFIDAEISSVYIGKEEALRDIRKLIQINIDDRRKYFKDKDIDIKFCYIEEAYKIKDGDILNCIEKIFKNLSGRCHLRLMRETEISYELCINISQYRREKEKRIVIENILNSGKGKFLYNDAPHVQGIYCILNTKTNKKYIGSSVNVNKRISQHIEALRLNNHCNYKLQLDFNTYELDTFRFSLLEVIEDISRLPLNEWYWIENSGGLYSDFVYNMSDPMKETAVIEMRNNMKWSG